jgi:hypothetical protein
MGCPHCGSDDIRRSHTSFGLDRLGLHRCRCRRCRGLFWLRTAPLEAARARRRELEAQGALGKPGRKAGTEEPPEPDAPSSRTASQPAPDLTALDEELSRRRAKPPTD